MFRGFQTVKLTQKIHMKLVNLNFDSVIFWKIMNFLKKKGKLKLTFRKDIKVMEWQKNSPDMSTIENIWLKLLEK